LRYYRRYRLFIARKVLRGSSDAEAFAYLFLVALAACGLSFIRGSFWGWVVLLLALAHGVVVADAGFRKGWLRK
jgi:hypothetical protein